MFLRSEFCAIAILAVFGLTGGSSAVQAQAKECAAIQGIDTNNDGTIDLDEVKAAATNIFDKLDKNHDGTLSIKELQGRVTTKDFAAANPDKDKTLSKDEYLALVTERFKAADVNSEGTVDCKEATSKAGKRLMRLLK